jgi:hypothetical protein
MYRISKRFSMNGMKFAFKSSENPLHTGMVMSEAPIKPTTKLKSGVEKA